MTKILPLVTLPAVSLRKTATLVDPKIIKTREFQNLLDSMIATMHAANGIGIAAVQVGDPRSAAIVFTKDGPVAIINPKIMRHGWRKEKGEEGCLSVPGQWAEVRRAQYVRVEALNREGNAITVRARGFLARVFQHEIDHLNGFLIVDRATKIVKHEPKP